LREGGDRGRKETFNSPNKEETVKLLTLLQRGNSDIKLRHKDKGKGKAIPLQTWTGLEFSRRLRLPDFKTICT